MELTEELAIEGHVPHDVDLIIDRLVISPDHYTRLTEAITQGLELGKGLVSLLNSETHEEQLFSQYAFSARSNLSYPPLEPHDFSFNHPLGMCSTCHGLGVNCPSCKGARIRPYPAATLIAGKRIAEVTALSIAECAAFFRAVTFSPTENIIADELLKEIRERLAFLVDVGLHYLTLDRTAPTLSGGEAQRVRLSSQIGSGLVGATYVLDEPSIGLHPRDNAQLLLTLKRLRDKGNTVIVVEHDEETIAAADEIVDVGPLAGDKGGRILAQGSLSTLLNSQESLTGAYLSGRKQIPIPQKRRRSKTFLSIEGACHHNLKNVDLKIPLGLFVGVTGVSGSGKSSLILDTLYPALANKLHAAQLPVGKQRALKGVEQIDKIIAIDQTPIGRTPRSNPATYIKVFDEIRDLFAKLPESQARGWSAGRFSFNVEEGSCPHCQGAGMTRIDMDFMEDEWLPCTHCHGKRFDEQTLLVRYRGKTIHDVLEMTVNEAHAFFEPFLKIREKLDVLLKVGLDYVRLGQPSPTLSGGEAQRIKLAKELARPAALKTFYILDEPTTGLHFHDIHNLILVLQTLVQRGHTVLVIEHNMDLIKTADWVIDLGPEGGAQGGYICAQGTPEQIAAQETPTGVALRRALQPLILSKSDERKGLPALSAVTVKGATQNNLKGIDVSIPHGKITVCTGPSGSGKSSLAFETIYAEGQRRYSESLSTYARQFVKQSSRPEVEQIDGILASIAIEQKNHAGNPRSTLGTLSESYDLLRLLYAHLGVAYCPETLEKIETISKEYVLEKLLALPEGTRLQILSPLKLRPQENFAEFKEHLQKEGFLRLRLNGTYYELDQEIPFDPKRKNSAQLVIDRLAIKVGVRTRLFEAIDQAASRSEGVLLVDTGAEDLFFNLTFAVAKTGKSYPRITPHTFSFNTQQGMCLECSGLGCASCKGSRLNPLARHVRLNGASLSEFCHMPLDEAAAFIEQLKVPEFLEEPLRQLKLRLELLISLGLGYLPLERSAPTLSGGETQRIRLARQLGSGLTGCLYVLDEPTIGLHPHDNDLLNRALKKLCALGNTLLLVEHDPLTIRTADYLLDFGPGAGKHGGYITARGTLPEIMENPSSLTGLYLSGKKKIPIPVVRRPITEVFRIKKATLHNLKGFDVAFPLHCLTCVTGVSGSGKSTLVNDLLGPAIHKTLHSRHPFDKLLTLSQNPIGHTNRADVSTYVDLLTPLRTLFSELAEAKRRGLKPKHFSFNHRSGMCKACWGLGTRTIPLQFLPSVKVTCEHCQGYRLNPLSLQVSYHGKHLGHILQMTVEQARQFLPPIPKVLRILDTLLAVGLGYLTLGQEAASLSGGEAQRLRLSCELSKRSSGKTLYLLDEPTIGLHSEDIAKLLPIFHALIDKGNTLILIEHNLDVIASADYVIDLGPGAGIHGGQLVATGTPEEIAKHPTSLTGKYLAPELG